MRLKVILTGSLLFASMAVGFAQQIQTSVNGRMVYFPDVQPTMINNRVMVPLRGVFEEMGATVNWNAYDNTVSAEKSGNHVSMRIGETFATVNNRPVALDSPAILIRNRVMVPLRFLSESIGAQVDWDPRNLIASIDINNIGDSSGSGIGTGAGTGIRLATFESGSVIPFKIDQTLTSNKSTVGERFTGTIDTRGDVNYAGLPAGTIVVGHVEVASAKTSTKPGVLGLAFDRIRLPDGKVYPIKGSLIGLDENNVEMKNGKLVAKSSAKHDLKYVGIGAGAGALIAIVTKGNLITSALLGGALGYLYEELQRNPSRSNNVTLDAGTQIGVRLDRAVAFETVAVK